jgi:hypothetical protein
LSLVKEREERRDPAMQALGYLISRVAENVQGSHSLSKPWHLDPFTFRAFSLGVARVLAALAPRGEMQPPDVSASLAHYRFLQSESGRQLDAAEQAEELHRFDQRIVDRYKTPESAAEYAAEAVLGSLFSPLPTHIFAEIRARYPELESTVEAMMEGLHYAPSDARRDLGIKLKEPKS